MAVVKNKKSNTQKKSINKSWEKVKIRGKVISDDGGGYEGLIGLEVLKAYKPNLISSEKKIKRKQEKSRIKTAKKVKGNYERKVYNNDDNESKKGEDSIKLKKRKKQSRAGKDRFALIRAPPFDPEKDEPNAEQVLKCSINVDELEV